MILIDLLFVIQIEMLQNEIIRRVSTFLLLKLSNTK